MAASRLLERLAQDQCASLDAQPEPGSSIADSIAAHVQVIVNTVRGSVPANPDYGLPWYYPGEKITAEVLLHDVEMQIKRHEPRLYGARVTPVRRRARNAEIGLELRGEIADRDAVRFQVSYGLTREQSGWWCVERIRLMQSASPETCQAEGLARVL